MSGNFPFVTSDGVDDSTERGVFYSDETTTGDSSVELRGPKQISIAARFSEDAGHFDWVARLHSDFQDCLPAGEVKSRDVIRLCEINDKAKHLVLKSVEGCDIYIIDLFQDYYDLCNEIRKFAPDPSQPIKSLAHKFGVAEHEIEGDLASERRIAVFRSIAPMIDYLRSKAIGGGSPSVPLVDMDRISKMKGQELREYITRLTVAFGDAVNPGKRAEAITKTIASRFSVPSHFAIEILDRTTQFDLKFDKGSKSAMAELERADEMVQQELEGLRTQELMRPRRSISQHDSSLVLGVQACDIAAGFARWRFEKEFDGDSQSTAKRLRNEFRNILYNSRWL